MITNIYLEGSDTVAPIVPQTVFCTCTTYNSTELVVTPANSDAPAIQTGLIITVAFTGTTENLQVGQFSIKYNSGTAKYIKMQNSYSRYVCYKLGSTVKFIYDGTYWQQLLSPASITWGDYFYETIYSQSCASLAADNYKGTTGVTITGPTDGYFMGLTGWSSSNRYLIPYSYLCTASSVGSATVDLAAYNPASNAAASDAYLKWHFTWLKTKGF